MMDKDYFEGTGTWQTSLEQEDDALLGQEIRAAFHPIAPDETQKARMLQGILAAAAEEEAAPAAHSKPAGQSTTSAEVAVPEEPKPVEPLAFPADPSTRQKKRNSINAGRRYATWSIAACLVLVVGVGVLVPTAMKSADTADFAATETSAPETESTANDAASPDGAAEKIVSAESTTNAESATDAATVPSHNAFSEQSGENVSSTSPETLVANRKYARDDHLAAPQNSTGQDAAQDYGWGGWIWLGQTDFETKSGLTGTWRIIAESTDSKTGATIFELGFTLDNGTDPGWKAAVDTGAEVLYGDYAYRAT